jgi:hypothetical protein
MLFVKQEWFETFTHDSCLLFDSHNISVCIYRTFTESIWRLQSEFINHFSWALPRHSQGHNAKRQIRLNFNPILDKFHAYECGWLSFPIRDYLEYTWRVPIIRMREIQENSFNSWCNDVSMSIYVVWNFLLWQDVRHCIVSLGPVFPWWPVRLIFHVTSTVFNIGPVNFPTALSAPEIQDAIGSSSSPLPRLFQIT